MKTRYAFRDCRQVGEGLDRVAGLVQVGKIWACIGGLNEPRLKETLGIPDDVRAPLAIVLGYPVSWPEARPRKSLDQVIYYHRYC